MGQDIKTFQNPSGAWEHVGSFSIELTSDAGRDCIPSSAEIKGDIVYVSAGSVKQVIGGIQFYSENSPFGWDYSAIKVIRDGDGNLLWVNYNYR